MPNIIAISNPITRTRYTATVPAGKPLHETMKVPQDVLIQCNGADYNGEPLEADDLITLVRVPRGGDNGKEIARMGIILAAQVTAAALTAGMSTWAQIAIRAGVTIGATYAAYELIPPPQPDVPLGPVDSKRLGSLTGSRNQYQPYAAVPRVYGKRKMYPLMSARPYTEIEGNDQYQRLLFCVGQGPVQLAEPKIGKTSIGSFNQINV